MLRIKSLLYACILGMLIASLACGGEVRKLTREDLEWGDADNTVTSEGGHVGHYFDNALNRSMPWFDVRAYGAKGDGVADDATAIDNAMNAAGDAGGGTILIPDGTWMLATKSTRSGSSNSYVVPRDNVTVLLAPNAVVKVASGQNTASGVWNIFYTTNLLTNFAVIGLGPGSTIDGGTNPRDASWTARPNTFIGSPGGGYHIRIGGITFLNMPGNNPLAFSAAASVTQGDIIVEKCRFIDGGSGISGNYSTDFSAIYLLGTGNKLINNRFENSTFPDNVTTAWEDHGIDFEAYGNVVINYQLPFWLTSESGPKRITSIHDNFFDNVFSGGSFSSGNNNGFGVVNYYNNTVVTRTGAAAELYYYTLYGPDGANDTADEWNVYNNRFDGGGENIRLIGNVGAKIFRFYNNHAQNYAGIGIIQSTDATFDSTYANYSVEVVGNTFYNFTGDRPISDIGGGTVKWLTIDNNKLIIDDAFAITAIYLRTTVEHGGTFAGNYIDNNYAVDFDFGSGMAKVQVSHNLNSLWDRTANWAAKGSRVFNPATNIEYMKVSTDNTWRASINDNVTSGHTCNAAARGDVINNTGTDNVLSWYCDGTTWQAH